MKKYAVICAGLCAVMAFTSCKSSESAYKQAYLKAKAQDEAQTQAQTTVQEPVVQQQQNVVVPMREVATNNTRVVDNGDNIKVRQESVSVVNGTGLKAFSVVVGSFMSIANAEGLQQTLKNGGYNAQIVLNSSVTPPMYRVVATTFDSKLDAAASRDALAGQYQGAWLLYAK